MNLCLIAHGLPPRECTGVEVHADRLARAFARQGVAVSLVVPRASALGDAGTVARETRGGVEVHWVATPTGRWRGLDAQAEGRLGRAVERVLDRRRCHGVIWLQAGGQLEVVRRAVGGRALPQWLLAHDDALICERDNLLRPDGTTCTTLGDPGACERCLAEDGDSTGARGPAVAAGQVEPRHSGDVETPDSASHTRAENMARWLGELRAVLVPTEHLGARLRRGGVPPGILERHACGVDLEPLASIEPPRTRTGQGRLRFGFLGALIPSKGPQVFLEAARRLGDRADFVLRGAGPDPGFIAGLRETCLDLGLPWEGGFVPAELGDVLGSIDVLVVPSLWNENAPFIIREAQAAGRVVIASRGGALPESVREGVDGLLVDPGDVQAWVEAMGRLCDDRDLAQRLAEGCRTPRSVASEAEELRGRIESDPGSLRAASDPQSPMDSAKPVAAEARGLTSLADLRRSRSRLAELDIEGLSASCDERLRGWAEESGLGETSMAEATVPLEDRLREAWGERDAELAWLRSRLHGAEVDLSSSRDELRAITAERDWLRGVLGDKQRELIESNRRLEGAVVERSHRLEEVEWLRAGQRAAVEESEALRGALEGVQGELSRREEADRGRGEELDHLRRAEREASDHGESLLAELGALQRHAEWLESELRASIEAVEALGDRGVPGDASDRDEWAALDGRFRAGLAVLGAELEWRREQMSAAAHGGGKLWGRLRSWTGVGARLEAWAELEARAAEDEPRAGDDHRTQGSDPSGDEA